MTDALKAELDKLSADLSSKDPGLADLKGWPRLMSDFAEWKAAGETGEHQSFFFGKDVPYVAPKLAGGNHLFHAHLPPMADKEDLERWNKAYYNRLRSPRPKVSNRVLVYCQAGDDYLLIFILNEPDAHEIAEMNTPADEAIMMGFARTAEAFIKDRSIIA